MDNLINVNMGQLCVSNNEDVHFETFVGSCVAICLYDSLKKNAGIAHIMLSTNPNGKKKVDPLHAGKYADEALETLIARLISRGSKLANIKAKLVGGADMFSDEGGRSYMKIGKKNSEFIKNYLKEKKIPIVSEDLGNHHGRRISFEVKSGKITCKRQNEVIML